MSLTAKKQNLNSLNSILNKVDYSLYYNNNWLNNEDSVLPFLNNNIIHQLYFKDNKKGIGED